MKRGSTVAVGTYVLAIKLEQRRSIVVGKLGEFLFEPGLYLYVGSALGPGGLSARVSRHLRHGKSLRWHIDYLTENAEITEVWWIESAESLECTLAGVIADMEDITRPVRGFGSSDCFCESHLFYSTQPRCELFSSLSSSLEFGISRLLSPDLISQD